MVPWTHSSHPPKRHLDRFSHFCRAHLCDQHTDKYTDTHTQTTLRVTFVAKTQSIMQVIANYRTNIIIVNVKKEKKKVAGLEGGENQPQ